MNDASNSSPSQSPTFQIQRLYVKEQMCKVPHAPGIFKDEWKPDINLEMKVTHHALETDTYEVVLQLAVTGKNNQRTAFTLEVQQAGIFQLQGFDAQQLQQLLNAYCPSILYPYARKVIADATMDASLPPLTLTPINFDSLYLEQQRQAQSETGQPTSESKTTETIN